MVMAMVDGANRRYLDEEVATVGEWWQHEVHKPTSLHGAHSRGNAVLDGIVVV